MTLRVGAPDTLTGVVGKILMKNPLWAAMHGLSELVLLLILDLANNALVLGVLFGLVCD